MIIGLVRRLIPTGPDSTMDLGPGLCYICGSSFTPLSPDGLAVDEHYRMLGTVCPGCLRVDEVVVRHALRERARAVREADPRLAAALEQLAQEEIWKPSVVELAAAEREEVGWDDYVDDASGGWIYSAWFGPPIDAADEAERARRRCHQGDAGGY
jgi:hypothetical protein